MNTSDSFPGSLDATAAGFPDPALLTRLANEFFRAGSESGGSPSLPNALGIIPSAAPIATPPATIPPVVASAAGAQGIPQPSAIPTPPPASVPSEAQLRALPGASLPDSTQLAQGVPSNIPSPGFPGGFSSLDFSKDANFSFLQDARSLFSYVPAAPLNTVPIPSPVNTDPVKPPALSQMGSVSALPVNAVPSIPSSIPSVAAPQIPGAPTHTAILDDAASFGFLDQITPLEPFSGVPTLEAYSPKIQAPAAPELSSSQFDVAAVRRDFPILQERVNGRQLIWLDNAATTQKPQAVIDRLAYFYTHENSNIHRAAHTLAARSTDAYEAAREKVRRFLNAPSVNEIIFVRGATEAVNLVAQSWGRKNIQKDDEIVVSILEHHANIVPWQMLCAEKGARLRVAPVDNTGQILLDEYEKLLNHKTRLVALTQVSNALGTITPVRQMTQIAHRYGAKVLIDGAQAVSHMSVDVQAIDCDFYVFSGHKLFAPTGIGVVFGKSQILESTPPWQGGGNMIADVTFEKTLYQPPPGRFEAGTGNIADAVGLGAAIDYLDRLGMANIARYEHDLLVYGTDALQRIPGLRLIGTASEKASVLSFVLEGFKTEEVGAALNREGIAVRSGHHCAQPILRRFGLESTVRPSLAFYNTCEEIDALVVAIWNLKNGRNPGL